MACIGRCLEGNWRFWSAHFDIAFALPDDNRAVGINLFPRAGEQGWEIPDLYHDNDAEALDISECEPGECAVVARHVASDLFEQKLKLAGVVVLGVVATCAVIGVVAVLAAAILELTAEIFISLGLLLLEWAGASILAYITTAGVVVLGTVLLGLELANAYAAMLVGVATIWSKVMIPNITRGQEYLRHRDRDLRRLEFAAARNP